MYSSLYEILPKHFPNIKFFYKKQIRNIKFQKFQKIAIVRNPYNRIVSTYYDKCQKAPEYHLNKDKSQLQYCQHQLLNAIKKIRKENFEIAIPAKIYTLIANPHERTLLNQNFEILKSISFEEYVKCMDLILNTKNVDGHFEKQYDAFNIPGQNPIYNPKKVYKSTKMIKLESIDQKWPEICDQLGINMEMRKINQTDNMRPKFNKLYSKETKATIGRLYNIDFQKFDYSLDF